MWHVEESPAEQCSAGAAAKPAVITAYTYYGMVMAVSIFALSRQRPKKAFTTISLILLFYAIFWCIPLFTLIVVEATSNDPILLGYISLLIAIFSDLYSCVAIFVYLAKHPELREYFMKEIAKFSRLIQLTDRRTQAPHLHNLNKHTDREQNQGDIPN
uniref:G-protein coupled receptors family 1 profile domain-containing protein n=1 Tax=Acrobeloides nanus TaxID=290746 RepID=A0A914DU07_9BILA